MNSNLVSAPFTPFEIARECQVYKTQQIGQITTNKPRLPSPNKRKHFLSPTEELLSHNEKAWREVGSGGGMSKGEIRDFKHLRAVKNMQHVLLEATIPGSSLIQLRGRASNNAREFLVQGMISREDRQTFRFVETMI